VATMACGSLFLVDEMSDEVHVSLVLVDKMADDIPVHMLLLMRWLMVFMFTFSN
jgi:hypothetical protein